MAAEQPFIAHLRGVVRELGGRCFLTKVGDVLNRQGYTLTLLSGAGIACAVMLSVLCAILGATQHAE